MSRKFNPIIQVENDGLKLPEPVGSWSEKSIVLWGAIVKFLMRE
jgi:hypothetical protein